MSTTSYPTTPRGVEIILAYTPDLTPIEITRYQADLWAGFRIELPTGVSVAYNGMWPSCFTVWPARPR